MRKIIVFVFEILFHLYRVIIPKSLRVFLKQLYFQYKHRIYKQKLKGEIILYYDSLAIIQSDINKLVNFLRNNAIHVFPYDFSKIKFKINIWKDKKLNLIYTIYENKKIYFRRDFTPSYAKKYFHTLFIEQNLESAHRYLTNDFNVSPNSVVADIGGAEGIFAIGIIDFVSKAYIFESDEKWVEALEATFAPFQNKVSIIKTFVTNKNEHNEKVSIDAFFENKKIDFIKIDVEGAEKDVLEGASEILKNRKKMKIVICTYHKQDDAKNIENILKQYNFECKFSDGYMLNYYDSNFAPPYFRRGLIRAEKF